MRKVVDAGYLRRDELVKYLGASRRNEIVLIDYACMESLQGRSTINFFEQTKRILRFPEQILILKGTRAVCRLALRSSGLQRRMIDHEQTNSFRAYCRRQMRGGHSSRLVEPEVLAKSDLASRHIDSLCDSHSTIQRGYAEIQGVLGQDVLSSLRSNTPLTARQFEHVAKMVLLFSAILMRDHPDSTFVEDYSLAQNHFLFRHAISSYALMLDWFAQGGFETVNVKRFRNDMIDSIYVAYSTFFDGLLTRDEKMKRVRRSTMVFLSEFQRRTAKST